MKETSQNHFEQDYHGRDIVELSKLYRLARDGKFESGSKNIQDDIMKLVNLKKEFMSTDGFEGHQLYNPNDLEDDFHSFTGGINNNAIAKVKESISQDVHDFTGGIKNNNELGYLDEIYQEVYGM